MVNNYKFKLLFIAIGCLLVSTAKSQDKSIITRIEKSNRLKYCPPKGMWKIQTPDYDFRVGNNIVPNVPNYELVDKKGHIVIILSVFNLTTINDAMIKLIDPKASGKNVSFYRTIALQKDSINQLPHFLSKDSIRTIFNADDACQYKFNNANSYRGRYQYCQILTLHKQDRSDIEIFYWYDSLGKKYINKCMADNLKMIYFLD